MTRRQEALGARVRVWRVWLLLAYAAAALASAKAPRPYLLMASGVGALHARIFAHLYPREVAGLLLLDPPQNETSAEALAWLQANRGELVPEIEPLARLSGTFAVARSSVHTAGTTD